MRFVICMKMYLQMFACVEQMCEWRTDIKSSHQIPAHCLHLLKFLYDSITHKLQKNTSGGCIYVRGVSAAETHAAYILQSNFKEWMKNEECPNRSLNVDQVTRSKIRKHSENSPI